MKTAEKNDATNHLALLAIVKSVEYFQKFLYRKEFIVKTYHIQLTTIQTITTTTTN